MNETSLIESALNKDKVSTSLSASRDQWLKRLEEETLKKRRSSTNTKEVGDAKDMIITSRPEKSYEYKYIKQFDEVSNMVGVSKRSQNAVTDSAQKLNHNSNPNAIVCLKNVSVGSVDEHNMQLTVQYGTQKVNNIRTNSNELVKAFLQKEQKYFELRQPFTVAITPKGVQVWLRDSSINGERYQHVLLRLREGLRDIGMKLLSLSINGELICDYNNSPDIKDELDTNSGINKVY